VTDAVLTDLPGYGYAAVPKADKVRWQQVMANYLVTRASLRGVVLLCDPRHGMTELDDILLEVIRPRVESGLKFLVLLTKADKLKKLLRIPPRDLSVLSGDQRRHHHILKRVELGQKVVKLKDKTEDSVSKLGKPLLAELKNILIGRAVNDFTRIRALQGPKRVQ
jgi:GTP-binding protein